MRVEPAVIANVYVVFERGAYAVKCRTFYASGGVKDHDFGVFTTSARAEFARRWFDFSVNRDIAPEFVLQVETSDGSVRQIS